MTRITSKLTERERVIVRLLRRYAACREIDQQPLPSLIDLGLGLGVSSFAVIAIASVFQLAESCLRRTLVAEGISSRELSSDERAILRLMETKETIPFVGDTTIPSGLLGALYASRLSAIHLTSRI